MKLYVVSGSFRGYEYSESLTILSDAEESSQSYVARGTKIDKSSLNQISYEKSDGSYYMYLSNESEIQSARRRIKLQFEKDFNAKIKNINEYSLDSEIINSRFY